MTIYDEGYGETKYYDATINLLALIMSLENTLTDYMYNEFLINCQNVTSTYFIFTGCPSQGF